MPEFTEAFLKEQRELTPDELSAESILHYPVALDEIERLRKKEDEASRIIALLAGAVDSINALTVLTPNIPIANAKSILDELEQKLDAALVSEERNNEV